MPIVKSNIEGDAPSEPHLALYTDESGLATAIPPGATLFLVEDPSRADKVFPMILLSVSKKALLFACACGDASCTRKYKFVNNVSGMHAPKKRNTAHAAES